MVDSGRNKHRGFAGLSRRSPPRQESLTDLLMFRVGALGLGLISGLVLGALLLLPLSLIGIIDTSPPQLLLASTLASAMCGLVVPRLALIAIEGLIHFFAGLLSIVTESAAYDPNAPLWLRASVVVGALYAGGTLLLIKGISTFYK